jgi:hypothetical protein
MQAVGVDLARRDRADGDLLGAGDHGAEQRLASAGGQLLGVVQQRQRPDAMVAQAVVVEQDARDDERPGKGAAAGFVGSRYEARAEAAVKR